MNSLDPQFKKVLLENANLIIEAGEILRSTPIKTLEDFYERLTKVSVKYNKTLENLKENCPDMYEKLCKNKTF